MTGREAKKQMEWLYHYTTPEGLIGIVRDNCLWATDAFYINDANELLGGARLAHEQLRKIRERTNDEQQAERIDWLLHDTRDIGTTKSMRAFVCSLSEKGDLLSQWRAYCPGGGFAIGFPVGQLTEAVKAQQFTLKRCIYDEAAQEKAIQDVLESVALPWIQAAQLPVSVDDERYKVSGKLIFETIRTASRLKHASFAEEHEWRIVSPPEHKYDPNNRFFRGRNGLILPYTKVPLPEGSDFWGKVRVVVGPAPHPIESESSVNDLVRRYKRHRILVESSQSPYREW